MSKPTNVYDPMTGALRWPGKKGRQASGLPPMERDAAATVERLTGLSRRRSRAIVEGKQTLTARRIA